MIADRLPPIQSADIDSLLTYDDPQWLQHWLRWLCGQIKGAEAALLVTDAAVSGSFAPKAFWPLQSQYESVLMDAAEVTLNQKTPLIKALPIGARYVGSWPIIANESLRAVITIIVKAEQESDLHDALAKVEWCSGWVELLFIRQALQASGTQIQRQDLVLDGIAGILGEDTFEHAALYYVNTLAARLLCDRVVLGFCKQGEVDIHAQSHSSSYSDRHALVKYTVNAMQEAVDQKESIQWPPQENQVQVAMAHSELNEALGTRALLTVPLVDQAECYGAVLFERHSENPFSEQDIATAEALANLVGSALEEKRQASLPLYAYVKRALELQLTRLLGPGFLWRKVAVAIVLALLLFFSFAKGDYNLSADAVLEGEEVRAMVASFDSYIESANYRAGDKVAQGDVLAVLDTRELRLQRISWQSQLAQSQRQYEEALAKQERAQVQINTAQVERARAELQLIDFQIGQAKLEAPFDALIISGDLSQRIGGVVKQGDVLFELSPRERFRLALYVDEFRINDVKPGQSGRLVLAALSEQEFPFQVTRINPMAEVRDGKTLYRVEADLLNQEDILRAGLEGVAQIGIDQRLLISIWTRGLRDWLRLEWWRFWG